MSSPASPRRSPDEVGERVRRRLERLQSPPVAEPDPERWSFRKAAAFLTWFDPALLRPAGDAGVVGGAVLHLIDDCGSLGVPSQRIWELRPEVRVETLRRIRGRKEALAALEANPDRIGDGVERSVHDYLRGVARPLGSQSLDELSSTLAAVRWLSFVRDLPGIPSVEEVAAIHQRKQLYEPLELLVGDTFDGRAKELAELRLHVGILDPSTANAKLRSVGRRVRRLSGAVDQPPLMVYGPGGIGKSTLLAKFLLDHTRLPQELRIPFFYLDFERPTLSVLEPATLVIEAARQLAIQYPGDGDAFGRVAAAASEEAGRQRATELELEGVSAAKATVHRDLTQALRVAAVERERALLGELATAVRTATGNAAGGTRDDPPLLVVLDSFEEAQYRSSPYLRRMWDMFDAVQHVYPMVRVVVSGRAPVEELEINRRAARYLPVTELDLDASMRFLHVHGITDPEAARVLADRLGGNPLNLKLAARLTCNADLQTDWVRDIRTRRWMFLSIGESLIQSQLYLRLLGNITDDDVHRLAHPGLVLRRITPEIIEHVLAEPCGVSVPDPQRARELFDAFAHKVDLVAQKSPGTLSHRPDVRRVMLRLIEEDQPRVVEDIERRAVDYYTAQEGPVARAEEIYHRLRLGQSPRDVDARWEPGVEAYLYGAQEEVGERAQAYLAAKLKDGRVPPEVLRAADLEDWELLTAREVEDLLDQATSEESRERNARAALELMRARPGRSPGSPLFRLEAEVLALLGQQEGARNVVERGISSIEDGRARSGLRILESLLDLLLLAAKLLEAAGQGEPADRELQQAEGLAKKLGRGPDVLATLLYRLQLQRIHGLHPEEAEELRDQTASCFLELPDEDLRRQPALVRSVALELGIHNGDVLNRAVDLLGLRVSAPGQLDEFAHEIVALTGRRSDFAPWLYDYATLRGVRMHDLETGVPELLRRLASTHRLDELAPVLIAQSDDDSEIRPLLAGMLPTSAAGAYLSGGDLRSSLAPTAGARPSRRPEGTP
jgi:cellulose synthase operon protein C